MYIHKAHYHTPTPLCISVRTLSYTILVQLAYIPGPSIHTTKNYKCVTLCGPCTTESHTFHQLMCQGPLMLVCHHALRSTHHKRMGRFPFHSYSCQTLEQCYPDGATPRCVLMCLWSYDIKIVTDVFPVIFGLIRLPVCPSQDVAIILLSACSTSLNSVPQHLGQYP